MAVGPDSADGSRSVRGWWHRIVRGAGALRADWSRLRSPLTGYGALAALALVALARFPHTPDWDAPAAWLYVAFLVTMLGLAAYAAVVPGGLRPESGPSTDEAANRRPLPAWRLAALGGQRLSGWRRAARLRHSARCARMLRQLRGRPVAAVALTHTHPDHVGGCHDVRLTLGVPLWCGDADADAVEAGSRTTAETASRWGPLPGGTVPLAR